MDRAYIDQKRHEFRAQLTALDHYIMQKGAGLPAEERRLFTEVLAAGGDMLDDYDHKTFLADQRKMLFKERDLANELHKQALARLEALGGFETLGTATHNTDLGQIEATQALLDYMGLNESNTHETETK